MAVGKLLDIIKLLTVRLYRCILGLGFCNIFFMPDILSPSDICFMCIWFHTPSCCKISSLYKGLPFTKKVLLYPQSLSLKIHAYILIFGKNVLNQEMLREDTVRKIRLFRVIH